MFGRRLTLFKLFGFEIRVDASWLIVAALVTWSLASGFFPFLYAGLTQQAYWAMGIAGAVGLFASIVVHELFHSLVARRYNLRMRGITLFIFGGIAEMEDEPPSAKSEFMMAIAGPIASVLIGLICWAFASVAQGRLPVQLVGVAAYLAWINLLLAAFNMIPAFPLDGGRVLRATLWYWKGDLPKATRIAAALGSGFGALLLVLAFFRLVRGDFIGAVWIFFIGMFIRGASQGAYQQVLVRKALEGEQVWRFMNSEPVTVRPETSVQELVDDFVYRHHHRTFPVVADSEELIGCVSTEEVKQVPRTEWNQHQVAEIAKPCGEADTVRADTAAADAFAKINKPGVRRLMVMDGRKLVAIVSPRDLLRFISTKLELEGHKHPELPRAA